MSNVVIGFATHRRFNVLSEVIKAVEDTPFSHVYVKYTDPTLEVPVIFQASKLALNYMGETLFDSESETVAEFALTASNDQLKAVMAYCLESVGKPYGIGILFGIGLMLVARRLGIKMAHNPFGDGGRSEICSEVGGDVLDILGANLDRYTLEAEGPAFLYEYVQTMPGVQRLK